ncbi:MAG TPA: NAD-dependent epimerase/dehydratase family protein [Candidatus Bilamarchaeaceae archaeon]|nr:NAD-dependent epimerase/dehydratase family protein [Candidatus Bilamarchaeaceae archaeon]
MAKVMVTGGAGFIGSRVVDELIKEHEVTVVDNLSKGDIKNIDMNKVEFKQADLCDASVTQNLLDDIEYCFHFAAKIGGIGYFHKYPAEILRDNTLMLSNILDSARSSKNFKKMVYISSSMVFERTSSFPSKEEDVFTSPPPISHYGFSKLVGEYYCKAFNEQYGINYTIFRPFNAYGPGEVPENEVGIAHVIPDLIKKVYVDKQYPIEILGNGSQVRAYTYTTDLANAIANLTFDKRTDNEDYNVANPNYYTVMELLEKIWRMCGPDKKLKIKSLPTFRDDVQKRIPSTKKIEKLGWKPKIEIDEGLQKTFAWIKEKIE